MRLSTVAGTMLGILLLGVPGTLAAAEKSSKLRRGAYLAAIMDCGGCHTPGNLLGKPDIERHLGGGDVGFEIPGLGIFYPPNLTPDPETGLGTWSEAEVVAAVRTGVRPDGRILAPAMPYHAYGSLSDSDARALAAYLLSRTPISNRVPGIVGPGEKPSAAYMTVAVPR